MIWYGMHIQTVHLWLRYIVAKRALQSSAYADICCNNLCIHSWCYHSPVVILICSVLNKSVCRRVILLPCDQHCRSLFYTMYCSDVLWTMPFQYSDIEYADMHFIYDFYQHNSRTTTVEHKQRFFCRRVRNKNSSLMFTRHLWETEMSTS
jgi:hypothetical protein